MRRLTLAMLVWTMTGTPVSAQSFACAKARTQTEKLVCADRSIANLDEHLGRYYQAAREGNPPAASCLRTDQAAWLKARRDTCTDAACLKAAYLDRLAELDPLQPGATALKDVTLPKVPALTWIVPPAADKIAAPANPKATPFEATGTIVNDVGTNPDSEGIVLRTADGKRIALMLLMFLDGPAQDRLASFARQPNTTYRARGFVTTDAAGQSFFEPSRCIFLHRMP